MAIYLLSEATAARRRMPIYCLDDTDGMTPETGLTFAGAEVQVSKAGGVFANFAGTVTELEAGLYYYEPTTGELDTIGMFLLKVVKTGVRTFVGTHEVHAINLNDAVRAGLTALPNAAAEAAGGLYTRGSGAGQINQDADGRVDTRTVAMAADTLTASALATDAVGEIADGVWDEPLAGHLAPGSTGEALSNAAAGGTPAGIATAVWSEAVPGAFAAGSSGFILGTNLDATISSRASAAQATAIQADTDDIQTRLPVALVGGRIDASVGAMEADTLTATALAASAVTEIQTGLATSVEVAAVQADTDNIQTRLPVALVGGRMDASVGAMAADTLTAAALAADAVGEIADGVWDEPIAGHLAPGSTGEALAAAAAGGSPAAVATAVWSELVPGAFGVGSAGAILGTNLDTTISSRASSAQATTIIAGVASVLADTDDIQTRIPVALVGGRIDASVGAMAADVLTSTALATSAVDEIADGVWDESAAGHVAAGSMGELENRLDATITSRASAAQATAIQADTDDIQTRLPVALVGGRIDASVGAMEADTLTATALAASAVGELADGVWDEPLAGHLAPGSTGLALSDAAAGGSPAAIATAVWSELVPGAFGAGSAGELLGTNLDATVSSRAVAGDAMDLVVGAVDAGALAVSGLDAIADAVWDEPIAGHLAPGTTGEALGTAGSGGLTPAQSAQLLEIWQIHGLELGTDLIVNPTSRTAGPTVVQTITTVGSQVTVARTP